MRLSIGQMLASAARRFGDKAALVTADRTLTSRGLDALASAYALELQARGIQRGDRITLWMENGWRWMTAYYGALRVGAVINPCNVLLTADEVIYMAQDCGAKAIIAVPEKAAELRGQHASLLDIDFDALRPAALEAASSDWPPVDGADTAAIVYTSGTTGRPKGARLTHSTILMNTVMTAQMHGRCSSDVVVSALPCTHVYGNIVMNAAVLCGMTLVLLPRFDELSVLRAIETYQATLFEGVPTMYLRLLGFDGFEQFDLATLRACTVGGQSMPVEQMEAAERRFGCRLLELWGMTELGGLAATHPHDGPKRLGSIGIPLPLTEVRVVSLEPDGAPVAEGEPGELLVRGPLVMQGYFGDDTASAAAIDPQGWLHTGDVVRRDADGYLYLVDRLKEVIVSGGYKIYPAEVERVIARHPAVALVAVAGMRDGMKGLVPKAFIVLRSDSACLERDIIDHCRPQLAAYKLPRAVEFRADLPKTSTGKILRRALADTNV